MNPWLLAARPPTLLAAVAPVLVGCGSALGDGALRWDAAVVTLVTAVLLNVAVNYANDASDARRGADGPGRIGPRRAVSSGLLTAKQMWRGTALVLTAATLGGLYLAWIAGWVIVAIGAAAVAAALAYTGGPWPYGYRGLGEVFVFLFFGVAAVVGSRYVHDATAPVEVWLLSVPVGLLVTAILMANNIRDVDTDRASGKRTLSVRLGRGRSRVLYGVTIAGAFVAIVAFAATGLTPRGTLLALLALPLTIAPVRIVATTESGPALIGALKGNARLHAVVGVLLAIGLAL